MSANINTLLEELYALEPNLKNHEKEIVRIIKAMMKNAPRVDIDESFRAKLRAKIQSEIGTVPTGSTWSWGWPTLSGFLACALLGVFVWNTQFAPATNPSALISFQPEIKQVAANAFKVTNANNRPQSGGGGLGGNGREMAMNNATVPAATPVSDAPVAPIPADTTVVVGTDAVAPKMMAPDTMIYPPMDFPLYNYVYSGELKLPTEAQIVYKKTSVPFNPNETRGIILSLNVDSINLGAMSNLGVSSISLTEDREYGYMTTIDFASGNISINQNWMKWPQPVCDMNGCNQKTLTESDVPSDATIRSAADAFITKFRINTSAYGEPIIDSSWRVWYARSAEMGQTAYVPEMYTITYPFMLDGQIVYEEGGMARGLTLNYDVRSGRITGFYGLEKQSLESSQYPAIRDMELVNKMIKQGTRYVNDKDQPLQPGQKVVDVSLGEPKLGYLHVYGEWKNGRSDEFLVPAWIFPVTGKPDTTNSYYYTPTFITIPLVADFVQKVDYTAYPMPMPLAEPAVDPAVMMDAAVKE